MREPMNRPIYYSVVDRCGNNWKTGMGGCGLLIQTEVSNTIATMFHPVILRCTTHLVDGSIAVEIGRWKKRKQRTSN